MRLRFVWCMELLLLGHQLYAAILDGLGEVLDVDRSGCTSGECASLLLRKGSETGKR